MLTIGLISALIIPSLFPAAKLAGRAAMPQLRLVAGRLGALEQLRAASTLKAVRIPPTKFLSIKTKTKTKAGGVFPREAVRGPPTAPPSIVVAKQVNTVAVKKPALKASTINNSIKQLKQAQTAQATSKPKQKRAKSITRTEKHIPAAAKAPKAVTSVASDSKILTELRLQALQAEYETASECVKHLYRHKLGPKTTEAVVAKPALPSPAATPIVRAHKPPSTSNKADLPIKQARAPKSRTKKTLTPSIVLQGSGMRQIRMPPHSLASSGAPQPLATTGDSTRQYSTAALNLPGPRNLTSFETWRNETLAWYQLADWKLRQKFAADQRYLQWIHHARDAVRKLHINRPTTELDRRFGPWEALRNSIKLAQLPSWDGGVRPFLRGNDCDCEHMPSVGELERALRDGRKNSLRPKHIYIAAAKRIVAAFRRSIKPIVHARIYARC